MRHTTHVLRMAVVMGLVGWNPVAPLAQGQTETFTATVSVKTTAGAQITAPVTIVITRMTTDAERTAVGAALKQGGTPAAVQALKTMSDAGYIEVGQRKTPLKYAYVRPMSGGRLITVVAPTPIVHLGAGLPDVQPKAGFDLSLALLDVKDTGGGSGELVPAATVMVTDSGAIQTKDYGAEMVQLTNVQAARK